MRPFVPRALNAEGLAALEQHRAVSRIEDNARHQGYQQGHAEGVTEGHQQGEAAAREELEPRLETLEAALAERIRADSLADTLRATLAARAEDRLAMEGDCAAAIDAALSLLFPVLSESAEGREAAALLKTTMREREDDILVIRAHPSTMERLRDAMRDIPADMWAKIRPEPDGTLENGAAAISWRNGGLTYDPAALLAKMAGILQVGTAQAVSTFTAISQKEQSE